MSPMMWAHQTLLRLDLFPLTLFDHWSMAMVTVTNTRNIKTNTRYMMSVQMEKDTTCLNSRTLVTTKAQTWTWPRSQRARLHSWVSWCKCKGDGENYKTEWFRGRSHALFCKNIQSTKNTSMSMSMATITKKSLAPTSPTMWVYQPVLRIDLGRIPTNVSCWSMVMATVTSMRKNTMKRDTR